jgi:D-alanyl-D-alanine dipeptidase
MKERQHLTFDDDHPDPTEKGFPRLVRPGGFDRPYDARSFGEPLRLLRSMPIRETGEPLVDLREACPEIRLMPGTLPFLRERVARMVQHAQQFLPPGHILKVHTCLRTMENQRGIREHLGKELKEKHPDWKPATMNRMLNRMVAPPDDPSPPPHSTGAAVDIGVCDADQKDLDFTADLDFWLSAPMFFPRLTPRARENRMMLIDAMSRAGFTNYVGEWWHWSYGDQGWALRVGHPFAYYGLIELPDAESKRIPVPEKPKEEEAENSADATANNQSE